MPRGLKPGNLVNDPGFCCASSGLRLLTDDELASTLAPLGLAGSGSK